MNRSSFSLRAFSLIEIVIALGIASFALVALLALLPMGVHLVRESSSENMAVNICTAIVSDLRSTPHSNESVQFHIPLTGSGSGDIFFDENGRFLGESFDATAIYKLSWSVQTRDGITPAHVHLVAIWPAASAQPQGLVETLTILRPSSHPN